MTDDLETLRLVAALAHSAPDADVQISGPGRRWVVSYQRPGATIDPCDFRLLVLASMRGCRVGLLPVERVEFIGGMRELGGGVVQRRAGPGSERRFATGLSTARMESLLAADRCHVGDAMTARLQPDDELGVTVVTLASAHPAFDHRLDVVALSLVSACLVEELIQASDREASP